MALSVFQDEIDMLTRTLCCQFDRQEQYTFFLASQRRRSCILYFDSFVESMQFFTFIYNNDQSRFT